MEVPMKILELKPNRCLLDSNFDGYKLSLKQIPVLTEQLNVQTDRLIPDSSQYSLLHNKLFVLQNHLIGETSESDESIYFVDKAWDIQKLSVDPLLGKFSKSTVFQIPLLRERKLGDYNTSMKLVQQKLVTVSDGMGTLYVLDRGEDEKWSIVFCGEVIGPSECFIITDAVYLKSQNEELHLLLKNIKQQQISNADEKNVTVLYWISLKKIADSWSQGSLRQLTIPGFVQYSYLEPSCEAVYVVSDSGCTFTLDSENEIKPKASGVKINYTWSQTRSDITLKFNLPDNIEKPKVVIKSENNSIQIKYLDETLIEGELHQRIDSGMTHWTSQNTALEVVIEKLENGLMWPEVIKGDQSGEYVADPSLISENVERLARLTSETEAMPSNGSTFNSQEVEECDFESDKFNVFERISCKSHLVTHRVNLGSHQILLTNNMEENSPPGLGIRSDVDICIWQPSLFNELFSLEHKGTLLALGYIQASKQQMKYFVCSGDLSYSAICESCKHIFIYYQKKRILENNELRNRATGQKINTLAQQQVYSLPSNDEILGVFASNTYLYVLGENFITALKVV